MNYTISVKNLNKTKKGQTQLDNVSLKVTKGTTTSILGNPDSQSSVLVKALLGLTKVNRDSEVQVNEKSIGYLPRNLSLDLNLTISDNIDVLVGSKNFVDNPDYVINLLGLEDKYFEKVKKLSETDRRLASLLAALIGDYEVYILDGLDLNFNDKVNENIIKYLKQLIKAKKTILFTTTDTKHPLLSNVILVGKSGKVVSGKPTDIFKSKKVKDIDTLLLKL